MHQNYGWAQGSRRRGERAQTTRFASFGPLVRLFFFFMFFLLLNDIYSYYDYTKATEGLREGGDEENGPKRRDSRRLGH